MARLARKRKENSRGRTAEKNDREAAVDQFKVDEEWAMSDTTLPMYPQGSTLGQAGEPRGEERKGDKPQIIGTHECRTGEDIVQRARKLQEAMDRAARRGLKEELRAYSPEIAEQTGSLEDGVAPSETSESDSQGKGETAPVPASLIGAKGGEDGDETAQGEGDEGSDDLEVADEDVAERALLEEVFFRRGDCSDGAKNDAQTTRHGKSGESVEEEGPSTLNRGGEGSSSRRGGSGRNGCRATGESGHEGDVALRIRVSELVLSEDFDGATVTFKSLSGHGSDCSVEVDPYRLPAVKRVAVDGRQLGNQSPWSRTSTMVMEIWSSGAFCGVATASLDRSAVEQAAAGEKARVMSGRFVVRDPLRGVDEGALSAAVDASSICHQESSEQLAAREIQRAVRGWIARKRWVKAEEVAVTIEVTVLHATCLPPAAGDGPMTASTDGEALGCYVEYRSPFDDEPFYTQIALREERPEFHASATHEVSMQPWNAMRKLQGDMSFRVYDTALEGPGLEGTDRLAARGRIALGDALPALRALDLAARGKVQSCVDVPLESPHVGKAGGKLTVRTVARGERRTAWRLNEAIGHSGSEDGPGKEVVAAEGDDDEEAEPIIERPCLESSNEGTQEGVDAGFSPSLGWEKRETSSQTERPELPDHIGNEKSSAENVETLRESLWQSLRELDDFVAKQSFQGA